ncbi:uncharacterized protein KY384_007702 [Bacidia gigantensis]|uniref:uncharacterized protein n=1 Tax=Bacidia gigantensis TaxID=2732470 RepID=UPI001D058501|nr:uncharacterized protein KY384_007702 [Bacidia gigantensis]KAG8527550.1 hypothetical protein KY384_007702 [Bacidia gigantensis]
MKLNTKYLRYLASEDWRVLTAVEMGSKNHEVVPTSLIIQLSNLRGSSGVHKSISTLAKANLIARTKNAKYDGYRLTYGGLDYLALHTHLKRDAIYSLGPCIGTGKESDIYVCAPPPSNTSNSQKFHKNNQLVLKIHRLGRISFRTVKNNRDYLRRRQSASWMYMSRLAAQREFAIMSILGENGFRVPEAVAWTRHMVVMSLVDGVPLRAVKEVGNPAGLYADLIQIILQLASFGIIHGDFNEFNIILQEEQLASQTKKTPELEVRAVPWIIDFPQAISIDHANAEFYFNRDVQCIKTYFERRFNFLSSEAGPFFADARKAAAKQATAKGKRLDLEVEASGFSKKKVQELVQYMEDVGANQDQGSYADDVQDESDDNSEDGTGEGDQDLIQDDPVIIGDPPNIASNGLEDDAIYSITPLKASIAKD